MQLTPIQKAALHLETALFGSNDAAQIAENMISHIKEEWTLIREAAGRPRSPVEIAARGLTRLFENEGAFA